MLLQLLRAQTTTAIASAAPVFDTIILFSIDGGFAIYRAMLLRNS
jgi:hypothetical protein